MIKEIRWPILYIPVIIALQSPLLLTDSLKNKVVMVAGLEIMCDFSSTDVYSPRPIWLWPPLSAQSATNKDQY